MRYDTCEWVPHYGVDPTLWVFVGLLAALVLFVAFYPAFVRFYRWGMSVQFHVAWLSRLAALPARLAAWAGWRYRYALDGERAFKHYVASAALRKAAGGHTRPLGYHLAMVEASLLPTRRARLAVAATVRRHAPRPSAWGVNTCRKALWRISASTVRAWVMVAAVVVLLVWGAVASLAVHGYERPVNLARPCGAVGEYDAHGYRCEGDCEPDIGCPYCNGLR